MTIADELMKLEQLHARGGLTDAEFAQAKARLLQGPTMPAGRAAALNGLQRSLSDRWMGGVCGGLAQATGLESWLWRLLFALTLFAGGLGLLVYLLMWIFVPLEPDLSNVKLLG